MNKPPEITEEEIRKSMNFDQVLAMAITSKRNRIRTVRNGLFLAGAILTGLTGYVVVQSHSEQPTRETQTAPVASPVTTAESVTESLQEEQVATKKQSTIKSVKPTQLQKASVSQQPDSVLSAYRPAEPVDGYESLYDYFNRELKYPEEGIRDSIQGVATVTFIIDKSGIPREFKTVNSLGQAFDRESIRLIEKMPPWKPAVLNGKPVDSRISIPLTFQIKTVKHSK